MRFVPFRLPVLVVTNITPKAARVPYMEDDAASFKTDIDSISSGLINWRLGISTLSTSIRGDAPAAPVLIEPVKPRNLILGLVPKSPVAVVMVKPGTAP